jgi:hypothetical protein
VITKLSGRFVGVIVAPHATSISSSVVDILPTKIFIRERASQTLLSDIQQLQATAATQHRDDDDETATFALAEFIKPSTTIGQSAIC